MKMFNLNSRLARRATATIALGLLLGAQTAMACTVTNWNGGNTGNLTPGGPDVGVARYSGLCAVQTPDSAIAYVQDDSPGGIDRIRARFYVLANQTSNAIVYLGFNGSDTEVFRVVFRGDGIVRLIDSNGERVSAPGNLNQWNSIEIDWNAGAAEMSLRVNGEAPEVAAFSSAETIFSVQLGNLNGAGGTMNFDAYESRRTTEIGRLLAGDANSDAGLSTGDLVAIRNELLDVALAAGQPDCNEDGAVSTGDLVCVRNILLGP